MNLPTILTVLLALGCTQHEPPTRPIPPTPIDALVIVEVPSAPAIALALGDQHSCALHTDGAVSCWGANESGQLGDGTTVERELPVRANIADVVELAAGKQRTCARKRDRSVWCWGATVEGKPPSLAPVKVAVTDAKQISASCAVRETGAVVCWEAPPNVHAIAGIDDAVQVANGVRWERTRDGSCAARASGRVTCWSGPDDAFDVPGIDDAVGVTVGYDFGCARRRGGGVTCWGTNVEAQLGRGTVDNDVTMHVPPPKPPGPVVGLADAAELAAGHRHACARTAKQRVMCWGHMLGTASDLNKLPVDAGIDATTVATGGQHACAIAGGKVRCWGMNENGQLGIGWSARRLVPTRVPGITDAIAVTVGYESSCALRRSGRVSCWGAEDARVRELPGLAEVEQLIGDAYFMTVRDRAGKVTRVIHGKLESVVLDRKATDVTSTCAVVDGGRVRCWGDNRYGQFGDGTTVSSGTPRPAAKGLTDAVDVAADSGSACAVRATGEVACWGSRLHDGTLGSDLSMVPELVSGIVDAKHLALGVNFACVLRASGRVACWGYNERGQLGNGGVAPVPMTAPTEVSGLVDAVQIAAGDESACARRKTGQLVCWGRNHEGQLGEGAVKDPTDPAAAGRSRPVEVRGITNAVDVSTDHYHTCAALADGSVWCWGRAEDGEVGTTVARSKVPLVVGSPPPVP